MKARIQKQSVRHKPRSKRASMGELHYFLLTCHNIIEYAPEVVRQQILDDTKAHCPTVFAAMQQVRAPDKAGGTPEWDVFTFTYHVPLPKAFLKDAEAYGGTAQ